MAILRIEKGFGAGNTYFIKDKVTIGRDSSQVEVHIADNKVSSLHAQVTKEDDGYYLEDKNSKNHTYINGSIVEKKTKLDSGDYINIGSAWLCFEEEDELDKIAKELDTYEILQQLQRVGGIGHHYKVRQKKLDRIVALQLLPPNIIKANADFKKKFRQQAKSLAKLNHENVAIILDFEAKESFLYYTTEYIDGESVQSLLDKKENISLDQALEIGMGVAYGLAHAHTQGVIHHNINPENVMLCNNRVILTGFGLAAILGESTSQLSSLIGNIEYFAPEKLTGRDVDYRSDIYSFGTLLYKLLTGSTPFVGESVDDIAESQLHDIPALTNFNANIPAELEKLVYQCLEREKESRPQEVGNIASTLENILYKQKSIDLAKYENIYTSFWKFYLFKIIYSPWSLLIFPVISGLLLLVMFLSK